MMIRYKVIEQERVEDAPFLGALISAVDCKFHCKGCFNQHLKDLPTLESTSQEIISEVKANPFNEGIILGGLEWTLQPNEMKELVKCAVENNLQVMIYTGLEEKEFISRFPDIVRYPVYVKYGQYREEMKTENNIQYDVQLASANQYIVKY